MQYTIFIIVTMVFVYNWKVLHNVTGLIENNYYSSNNHNFNVFRIDNYAGYLNFGTFSSLVYSMHARTYYTNHR